MPTDRDATGLTHRVTRHAMGQTRYVTRYGPVISALSGSWRLLATLS